MNQHLKPIALVALLSLSTLPGCSKWGGGGGGDEKKEGAPANVETRMEAFEEAVKEQNSKLDKLAESVDGLVKQVKNLQGKLGGGEEGEDGETTAGSLPADVKKLKDATLSLEEALTRLQGEVEDMKGSGRSSRGSSSDVPEDPDPYN